MENTNNNEPPVVAKPPDLPTFQEYMVKQANLIPDLYGVQIDVKWYGDMQHLTLHENVLTTICNQHNGLLKHESEEFKAVQADYYKHWKKVMILREGLLQYFEVRPPMKSEIVCERKHFGILLSEEDYIKYMTKPGSGIVRNVITEKDMHDDFKKKAVERRKIYQEALGVVGEEDSEEEEVYKNTQLNAQTTSSNDVNNRDDIDPAATVFDIDKVVD